MECRSSQASPAIASEPFRSAEEAAEAVLAAAFDVLGLRSVFLTRTDAATGQLHVTASINSDKSFEVPIGLRLPLSSSP